MKDESKKKNKTSYLGYFFIVLLGFPLLVLVMCFILGLSPFLLVGYIFYALFNYLNKRHLNKVILKSKLNNKLNF